MNKRKIVILLVLFIAVIGLTMGTACAASQTIKLKKNGYSSKKTYGKDRLLCYYSTYNGQYSKGVSVEASYNNDPISAKHTKLSKIKVYYKNKKGKVITRTKKASKYWAHLGMVKGYSPYKVTVWYSYKK